jgi:hypothetical protein
VYPLDVVSLSGRVSQRSSLIEYATTYHVVDAAEDTVAAVPVTQDTGIVLGLMASQVLLTREAPTGRLRALGMPAEEVFAVSLVVLAEVAAPGEDCPRGAARVGAGPSPVLVGEPVGPEIRGAGRERAWWGSL